MGAVAPRSKASRRRPIAVVATIAIVRSDGNGLPLRRATESRQAMVISATPFRKIDTTLDNVWN